MAVLAFLILFPLCVGLVLFAVKSNATRRIIVVGSSVAIAAVSLLLIALTLGTSWTGMSFSSVVVDYICMGVSVLIAGIILYFGVQYKNTLACVLAVIQVVGSLVFEIGFAHGISVSNALYFDSLSLLMTFIIGVVGSGICVYALGYMEDFQAHEDEDAPDRRPFFFGVMFIFLSAMYLIVFSDHLVWLFTGWEITTLASFLLIGYTRTEEAMRNAFRQIIMNLLGGIAFVVALFAIAINYDTLSLQGFINHGLMNENLVALPLAALAFAGITKAAQMPFHTWLLGAMVAPTPTSALLHSSTMVKAAVFLLLKLSPLMLVSPAPAVMTVLVGGLTFMFCSFMAISQSNAKRVLAYSTIANLGLIVACAGVGTPEAIWAGMFLMLFHAVAKSLLFLCVGTAEHHIGSRDIEDMDLLFERMPRLARFMMLGIMIMFIAPFGMLIAKWATLISFADQGQVALILLLGFGSAATFMFWAKWLGKLSGIAQSVDNVELSVHKSEWGALLLMVICALVACLTLPVLSPVLVEPYIAGLFGDSYTGQSITSGDLWIAVVLVAAIAFVLFAGLGKSTRRKVSVYLAGVSVDNEQRIFRNALSGETQATAHNWYLNDVFGEARIAPIGSTCCIVAMVVCGILSIALFILAL